MSVDVVVVPAIRTTELDGQKLILSTTALQFMYKAKNFGDKANIAYLKALPKETICVLFFE